MKGKKRKQFNPITIMLMALIIFCLGIILHLLIRNKRTIIPDYASGIIDTNAIKEDTVENKKEYQAGQGNVNLKFSNTVEIDIKEKTAKLYFKNPGTSSEDIVLYLIIRDNDEEIILGTSDVIPAGYAIYKMNLNNVSKLSKGGYNGILKTIYYNEKTKSKEMIDSEIKVKIEVK